MDVERDDEHRVQGRRVRGDGSSSKNKGRDVGTKRYVRTNRDGKSEQRAKGMQVCV